MVVTSVEPLRVYLFNGGVLPFGSLKGEQTTSDKEGTCSGEAGQEQDTCEAAGGRRGGDDLIVNLWRNRGEAIIWSMEDFQRYLATQTGSRAAFDRLWAAIQHLIGGISVQDQTALSCCCMERNKDQGTSQEW